MPVSLGLAVIAGLLHAASIITPWGGASAGWLQLFSMGVLVWQIGRVDRPAQAGWIGWAFAAAWLSGTFWWLYVAMHNYGGLAAWLAVVAVLALAGLLALYYAAACMAFAAWAPRSVPGAATLFAALWLLAELARGVWFTGFGWGAAGYAHVDGLAKAARFVGAYGIAALVAWIAFLVTAGLRDFRHPGGCVPWVLAGVSALLMAWSPGTFTSPTGSLRVGLLQGNIAQDEKFQASSGVADALRWYGDELGRAGADLFVAPETAIPLLPQQLPDGYWAGLQQRFDAGSRAALVGIPLGSLSAGYTNSVVAFGVSDARSADANTYRYDKHHLVPFGEFIPPLFRWFTELMAIPLGDFNRGAVGQPSFHWRGQRLAPNICYEDLFGEELGARFLDPATAPTIFVNVSNIAWFGDTSAIGQHRNISRMRALEFDRPFIRATNTGDTVIIDHTGRVTHALPRHARGILLGEVEGRSGTTPFAWWVSRWGLMPYWLSGVLVVLVCIAVQRRGHSRGGPGCPQASGSRRERGEAP